MMIEFETNSEIIASATMNSMNREMEKALSEIAYDQIEAEKNKLWKKMKDRHYGKFRFDYIYELLEKGLVITVEADLNKYLSNPNKIIDSMTKLALTESVFYRLIVEGRLIPVFDFRLIKNVLPLLPLTETANIQIVVSGKLFGNAVLIAHVACMPFAEFIVMPSK